MPQNYYYHSLSDTSKSYLHLLNPIKYPENPNPQTIENIESLMQCMQSLINDQYTLYDALTNKEVMQFYFLEVTEPIYKDIVSTILLSGTIEELLMFYRALYRHGQLAINDHEYNLLENLYKMHVPEYSNMFQRSYDDDPSFYTPLVISSLSKVGIYIEPQNETNLELDSSIYQELDTDKSQSIRPIEKMEELYQFITNSDAKEIHCSLKIDGINTKILFDASKGGLVVALSRGRASNSFNYTTAIRRSLSVANINTQSITGKLIGESFVDYTTIKLINSKYPNKNYRNPKSTAMAMLRSPQNFEVSDYFGLHTLFFSYNDLDKKQTFETLCKLSLPTPPSLIIQRSDIPITLKDFREYVESNIMAPLYEEQCRLNLPSDGIVVELLTSEQIERADHYYSNSVAIKFGQWSAKEYIGIVNGIVTEQQSVEMSIVLTINPVTLRDGVIATRVSGLSTAILVKQGIKIGDKILFQRKSEAYNTFIKKVE